jgi:hypothetical protein
MKITFPCEINGEVYELLATSTDRTAFSDRIWHLAFADGHGDIDEVFLTDVIDAVHTI